MSNRRKHGQADKEQQALLAGDEFGSINSGGRPVSSSFVTHAAHIGTNRTNNIAAHHRQVGQTYFDLANAPYTIDQSTTATTSRPTLRRSTREKLSTPISTSSNDKFYANHPFDQFKSNYVAIIEPTQILDTQFRQQYHGDSNELIQLKSLNSKAIIDLSSYNDENHHHSIRAQQTDFILYTVQPGDTLHNLSVKYSCPVASIKRLNNLWSDQEFFARSRIKLPLGKLRLIADVINEETRKIFPSSPDESASWLDTTSQRTSATSIHDIRNNNLIYGEQHPTTSTPLGDDANSGQAQEFNDHDVGVANQSITTDSLFKDLDQNIAKARVAAKSYDDNASAIMKTLAERGNIVGDDHNGQAGLSEADKIARREAETLLNDLSDFSLSYNFLVLFIFIVCLACPLAYVIYQEETHHDPRIKHSE